MPVALMLPPGAHPFERCERFERQAPYGASSEVPPGPHLLVGRGAL